MVYYTMIHLDLLGFWSAVQVEMQRFEMNKLPEECFRMAISQSRMKRTLQIDLLINDLNAVC